MTTIAIALNKINSINNKYRMLNLFLKTNLKF